MTFAEKIAKHSKDKGWSQAKLSRAAELHLGHPISKSRMSQLFNGTISPDLATAYAIARALGVPLEYLADDGVESLPEAPEAGELLLPSFNSVDIARLIIRARKAFDYLKETTRELEDSFEDLEGSRLQGFEAFYPPANPPPESEDDKK